MDNTTTTEPLITLPLRTYLDHLFTYKSNRDHILCRVAVLSKEETEAIRLCDVGERFCHVEYYPDRPNIGEVWPIYDWRTHYIRRQQLLAAAEHSRKNKELLELAKLAMAEAILKDPDIGGIMDTERSMEYVNKIVREKKYGVAAKFGCGNLEELLK